MTGQSDGDRKTCPQCGHSNPADALFCNGCGRPFAAQWAPDGSFDAKRSRPLDPAAFQPDALLGTENFGDASSADVTRMVGKRAGYYLPVFERLRHTKGMAKFHFAALIFGGGWMLYRKQYVSGAIVFALQLVLRAATLIFGYLYTLPALRAAYAAAGVTASQNTITQEQSATVIRTLTQLSAGQTLLCFLPLLFSLLGLICSIVVAVSANRWYFRHVMNTVAEVNKKAFTVPEERSAELVRRGGVNLPLAICLLVCYLILNNYSGTIIAALFS